MVDEKTIKKYNEAVETLGILISELDKRIENKNLNGVSLDTLQKMRDRRQEELDRLLNSELFKEVRDAQNRTKTD